MDEWRAFAFYAYNILLDNKACITARLCLNEIGRSVLAVKLYVHWTSAKLYVHWTSAIYSMPEFGSHWLLRCTNGQIRQSALVKVDQLLLLFFFMTEEPHQSENRGEESFQLYTNWRVGPVHLALLNTFKPITGTGQAIYNYKHIYVSMS